MQYLSQLFKSPFPKIKSSNTSMKETEKIISSLQSETSYSYDEISMRILKINAPFISSALNYICNKSMSPGIFPSPLKYSIIKPLFKTGDKKNMANYRPVS